MSGGTVALLGRALAAALAPLSNALQPAAVGTLFAELGLGLTPQALADAGFGAALGGAGTVAAELPALLDQLAAAIDTDDDAGTAVAAAAILGKVAVLRARLGDVGQAVRGLGPAFPTIPAAELGTFAGQLPARLIELLVISRMELAAPGLVSGLAIAGLIDRHPEPGVPGDPARPPFELRRLRLDRLPDLLGAPATHLRNLYGWGAPGFTGQALLAQLSDVAGHAGLPALLTDAGGVALLDLLVGTIAPEPGGLRADLRFPLPANQKIDIALPQPGWRLALTSEPALPAGLVARLSPPSSLAVTGPPVTGAVRAEVGWKAPAPDRPLVLLGQAGATRLQAASVTARAEAVLAPAAGVSKAEPVVELAIAGGEFVLDLGGAGALLSALMPSDVLRAEFDLAIGVSAGRVYLRGGAGLVATFPVHLSFGPAELLSVVVGLSPGAGGIPVELSATIKTALGPLAMTVERIGLIARFTFPTDGGNLGPLDVSFGFKAPNGIGVALEAGPIQGGGYLSIDPTGQRFAGVLAVKLSFIGITAFGIYEVTPGGDTSFVAVLGIRFLPGIQLGFGFALTGVGGLVGYNRRADADVLRDRLASGAAGNVLFCDDPVANAPTLLGDLAAFFPAAPGKFIVGPTFQIGWVAPIVRLDMAILIELPGPSKIIILGTVRVLIGADETFALLFLRMDVLGILDFEQRLISLDAYLVNSHALGVFRLTGGMALRLSYGDNPYILLSVGGFHPRFDPGPLNLPAIPRVGAVLDVSVVAHVYLRLELYVAFTSNTLQAGAKVEAGADLGPLSAHGYFTFDALIQFRPFAFDVEFSSGWSIEVFGESLCGVDVSGRITGPGPLVVHAHARITLLFISVSGSATFELGSHDGDAPVPVPSLVKALEPELGDVANLRADGGAADDDIVLRPGPVTVAGVLVGPRGELVWEQKRAPLDTLVDRFEGAPLVGSHQLLLDPPAGFTTTPEHDWFSPGTFTSLDLRSSQTLNNASFCELPSGFRFASGGDVKAPTPRTYVPTIDLIKRPTRTKFADVAVGCYLTAALAGSLRDRERTPAVAAGPPKVTVERESFAVLDSAGAVLNSAETPFQAFQLARELPGSIAVPADDVVVVL